MTNTTIVRELASKVEELLKRDFDNKVTIDKLKQQLKRYESGAFMLPMTSENGKEGWYLSHSSFYCDIESDSAGRYSIFFRSTEGKEAFFDQADVPTQD